MKTSLEVSSQLLVVVVVFIEQEWVTDRQTDRHTQTVKPRLSPTSGGTG